MFAIGKIASCRRENVCYFDKTVTNLQNCICIDKFV